MGKRGNRDNRAREKKKPKKAKEAPAPPGQRHSEWTPAKPTTRLAKRALLPRPTPTKRGSFAEGCFGQDRGNSRSEDALSPGLDK